jgi:hypothetical protein
MAAAGWSALFDSTLGWVEGEVEQFLLGRDPDEDRLRARTKPLGELLLTCDVGLRARGDDPRLRRLRDQVVADVGSLERLELPRLEWMETLDLVAAGRHLAGTMTTNAGYVLSHVVFARTDFGRTPSAITAPEVAWLRGAAPAWQRQFVADVDLLCVLVIMMRCVGLDDDAIDVPSAIAARQEPAGAVVSSHDIPPPPSMDERFFRRYHATLVANMAASLSR